MWSKKTLLCEVLHHPKKHRICNQQINRHPNLNVNTRTFEEYDINKKKHMQFDVSHGKIQKFQGNMTLRKLKASSRVPKLEYPHPYFKPIEIQNPNVKYHVICVVYLLRTYFLSLMRHLNGSEHCIVFQKNKIKITLDLFGFLFYVKHVTPAVDFVSPCTSRQAPRLVHWTDEVIKKRISMLEKLQYQNNKKVGFIVEDNDVSVKANMDARLSNVEKEVKDLRGDLNNLVGGVSQSIESAKVEILIAIAKVANGS
ncbi:hypothetical protein LOK49_LG01G00579 [Camellia lanceoleosa]|uniref:Uncharacterized protein n=1 Tax=Camellia lanceoleosa TaxID=1840588 RepID=A0ACC0J0R8_9ERIC|nr:hypothetical protein LOK49_LG01G00579 [Camellia lanceoleosa]